jgi:hypothetical protein
MGEIKSAGGAVANGASFSSVGRAGTRTKGDFEGPNGQPIPAMHNPAQYTPYHEMIARRAHEIWEEKGQPTGCEVEHWLQAEKELAKEARGEQATSPSANDARKKREPKH